MLVTPQPCIIRLTTERQKGGWMLPCHFDNLFILSEVYNVLDAETEYSIQLKALGQKARLVLPEDYSIDDSIFEIIDTLTMMIHSGDEHRVNQILNHMHDDTLTMTE